MEAPQITHTGRGLLRISPDRPNDVVQACNLATYRSATHPGMWIYEAVANHVASGGSASSPQTVCFPFTYYVNIYVQG